MTPKIRHHLCMFPFAVGDVKLLIFFKVHVWDPTTSFVDRPLVVADILPPPPRRTVMSGQEMGVTST